MGPAGSGKSTIALMFAHAAASSGKNVNYYAFDESTHILLDRAREMHLDIDAYIQSGRIRLHQMDPAQISPGELAHDIVHAVQEKQTRMVVLDSLNGYVKAMPNDESLALHLHEMFTYLNHQGVTTLMVLAQHGLVDTKGAPVDVSYLADTVVLTRFFEARGGINKAISVIKKRSGPHETTIREMTMSSDGIHIGKPLLDFQGVLTGTPAYLGLESGRSDQ
jgi:circadian clock protein KaiC